MKRPVSPHERLVAAKAMSTYKESKKALGLTMGHLGQQLGISQSAVSQYLNAGIPMGAETIIRLSDILKVDVAVIDPDFNTRFRMNITSNKEDSISIIGTISGRKPSAPTALAPHNTSRTTYASQVDSDLYTPAIEQGSVIGADPLEKITSGSTVLLRRIGESRFEIMKMVKCTSDAAHLTSLISEYSAKQINHQYFGSQFSMMGDVALALTEIITMHKVVIKLPPPIN